MLNTNPVGGGWAFENGAIEMTSALGSEECKTGERQDVDWAGWADSDSSEGAIDDAVEGRAPRGGEVITDLFRSTEPDRWKWHRYC